MAKAEQVTPAPPLATPDAPQLAMRTRWAAPVLLLLLAVALRLPMAGWHGLWTDEVFSLSMATGHSVEHPPSSADPSSGDYVDPPVAVRPAELARYARHEDGGPGRVLRAVRLSDTSPPLYYLVLHYWTRAFGTGDWALRMLSLTCAIAAMPLVWAVAQRVGGPRAARTALLLYAVLPVAVFYAVEGRMYAMVWLAASLNLWASARLVDRGASLAALSLWTLSAAAGLLTHYYFMFPLAGTCAWLLAFPGHARRTAVVGAMMASLVLVAPWYAQLPGQMAAWRLTGDWLTVAPLYYDPVRCYLLLPLRMFTMGGPWGVRPIISDLYLGALAAAAILVAWKVRRALSARPTLLPLLTTGAMLAGLVAFDLVRGTYAAAAERYVTPALPATVILVGVGLAHLNKGIRLACIGLIVVGSTVGMARMYRNEARNSQAVREAAAWLLERASATEVVIVHSIPTGAAGLARYLHPDPGIPYRGPVVATWVPQLDNRRVPDDLRRLIDGGTAVYIVAFHTVGRPPPQIEWLDKHAILGRRQQFDRVVVWTYKPAQGGAFEDRK